MKGIFVLLSVSGPPLHVGNISQHKNISIPVSACHRAPSCYHDGSEGGHTRREILPLLASKRNKIRGTAKRRTCTVERYRRASRRIKKNRRKTNHVTETNRRKFNLENCIEKETVSPLSGHRALKNLRVTHCLLEN